MLQTQHLLRSNFPIFLSHPQTHFLSPLYLSPPPLNFFHKPTNLCPVSAHSRPGLEQWLAEAPEPTNETPYTPLEFAPDGPEELPPSSSPVFATNDDPSSLQVATSVLLTGAITVFHFRSLRRRAKRAKELKFRSSGVKKSLKDEALDSLKALSTGSVEAKGPPSPVQALLGGISAGVIALILYKFTTTIEASLNRQTISDNFSVRQITITIRTIINGLCYLATFVFGINAVGLVLYAGQLAINSIMEDTNEETQTQGKDQSGSFNSTVESPANSGENSDRDDQSSDGTQ
ncbi:uncharacterized protein LOC126615324 isoform X1 [Malus sylvestris]|uniref:uncharacterized protein LOC126615324 isoform X1 n=1 Tax=Malus sylvestris TaxID=3752 RepID=UPI0021AC82A8|nr:uncharacterized protein LOC126615324 isoform X1 [Malus sylvestris]